MILDVGCGKNKRGDLGIDYSRNSSADIIADSHNLPFRNGIFDRVISITVLEHSPNPLNFLKEQSRILRVNGKMELVTDNAQYYKWSVMKLGKGGILHEDFHTDHYGIFFPKNVKRLMKLAGFEIEDVMYLRDKKSKMEILAKMLVKLGIWRAECLYSRFRIVGIKSN
jgi:2-polyprenyl-3-methyl-5-hydroxy-6-metoxy-1,4-benzoquinol methylase